MVGGVQLVLALAAGYWVDQHLLLRARENPWRRPFEGIATALIALVLVSYPLLFGLGAMGFVASRPEALFLSAEERTALAWLAEQPEGEIVLSAERTGNHIPAFSNAIPVLGHPIETLAVERKRAEVARFFASGTPPAERQAMLAKYGVNYIWWGPRERELGEISLAEIEGGTRRFRDGRTEIWQID
jgi:hypothetical protein